MPKINFKRNDETGGVCAVFHVGVGSRKRFFYADKSWVSGVGEETMIFPCTKEGKVNSWDEVYCDRSGKSISKCIEEFVWSGDAFIGAV